MIVKVKPLICYHTSFFFFNTHNNTNIYSNLHQTYPPMPLPQPGPSSLTMDGDDGGRAFQFNPVLVGLLGVIAGAILVATYHLIHSICTCYRMATFEAAGANISQNVHQTQHERSREISLRNKRGSTIPIFRYTKDRNEDVCAICLGDFKEGEQIRVLPDCLHFFHVGCIDKWLYSHTNCPLCRADTSSPPEVAISLPDSSRTLYTGLNGLSDSVL